MILADTNILSTFMRIDRLDLLFKAFNVDRIYISSNVFEELKVDRDRGYPYTDRLFNLIGDKRIEVVTPSKEELFHVIDLPEPFGRGELDSLVICRKRKSIFLSNDKKVISYCRREEITCFDLCDILAALWRFKILGKDKVRELVKEIEEKDNVIIPSKDIIFRE